VRRHCRLIAGFTIAGCAIACLVAYHFPSVFTAHARVKLDRETPDRDFAGDFLFVKLQVEVLQSQEMLRKVADALGPGMYSAGGEVLSPDQAVAQLKQDLWVRRNADNNLVEVYASAPDAERAAAIVNQLIATYGESRQKETSDRATATLRALTNEMSAEQQRLASAETRAIQLSGTVDGDRIDSADAELTALQQHLTAARMSALEQRIRAQLLQTMRTDDPREVALACGDATAQNLLEKLNDAEARLSLLQRSYGPEHSAIINAAAARDQCKQSLAEWMQKLAQNGDADIERANRRVALLQDEVQQKRESITSSGHDTSISHELIAARSDVAMEQEMVRALRERIQAASLDLIAGRSPVDVIEAASASTAHITMMGQRIIAWGILVGLMLGVMAGLASDQLLPRISDVYQVSARLNLPVLGTVSRRSRLLLGEDASDDELEHSRMLRNAIEFAGDGFRSLCIAGAGNEEGRSLIALNLAWAWAEQGARVLLVDAHRRRPVLHQALGVAIEPGLSDALSSRRSVEKFVQHTSIPNLLALCAGASSARGPAMSSDVLEEIHQWARDHVDIVIFDTAPLMKSSDACIVARSAEAVVLVIRRDVHPLAVHQRAVDMLAASNCNLIGAILNGVWSNEFELAHPDARQMLPFRVVRERTLHERILRNQRQAA
jgi:capsular exopolysaccharide synthesis family protein